VVERTLAWITSYRRCARDCERLPATHEATVYWAMITLMTRRLARPAQVQNKHLAGMHACAHIRLFCRHH